MEKTKTWAWLVVIIEKYLRRKKEVSVAGAGYKPAASSGCRKLYRNKLLNQCITAPSAPIPV